MADAALPAVSDTARWVAYYRALESERPDALFKDSFARRLAGERGQAIAESMPGGVRGSSWPMVVRTVLIDELVYTSLAEGVDRVLNLAAGLDTRPYRLHLPPTLSWVEADLPGLLREKERLLADEKPVCDLRREPVDLLEPSARRAFLERALQGCKRALVLTEGLLIYLEPKEVRALGGDLAAQSPIAFWMLDLASPGILRMLQRRTASRLGAGAQMKFGPPEGVAFFEAMGWTPLDIRPYLQEGARLHRLPAFLRLLAPFSKTDPRHPGRRPWSAVVRFGRRPA
ncbi:MAG: class I SAM-dependent methyltransferase [Myxococcaceae bacterium]